MMWTTLSEDASLNGDLEAVDMAANDRDVPRRWASVLAGVALMISVGSNHSISAWNAHLKNLLHYSQAEIALVCSMASFGAYFSVIPGYVFDHVGAHNSIILGGVLLSLVYSVLSVGIVEFPNIMHPILVSCAFAIVGQASNFGVFAALGPNEGLFGEKHRGKIMALQLAAFSAGGALFALMYHAWFDGDVSRFFRFMAITYVLVFLFGWIATYRLQSGEKSEQEPPHMTSMEEFNPAPLVPGPSSSESLYGSIDITGRTLLRDARFWLLFSTVFILVGASLFVMANIAFIVESLGGRKEQVSTMVALFSVGNCLGRLVAGAISDLVLAQCPRIYFVSLASMFVAFNHVLFLWLPASYLIVPITLSGVADGIMFASFPVLTRETFGLRHFGKNFGMISVANALGFPLFYSPIGSFVYKFSSVSVDGVEKCFGPHCFRPVFLLVIALCVVALFASLQFARRRPGYASLL
ncbi:hypothetical protein Poli38472_005395 [Pythium oligandrum]|uniref:Nodulin-like domain-containing protein n=1 Tax=Pythium oligandrum TaxID=41045 RepID=A0A8K1FKF4_PYTOL|nr:hypothetical protein Poli38472_005395 [Pythium oligandrum]|eukprot:TMW62777.1 hypothetical protein Poli38472_005395 [Pythium oligandrum]